MPVGGATPAGSVQGFAGDAGRWLLLFHIGRVVTQQQGGNGNLIPVDKAMLRPKHGVHDKHDKHDKCDKQGMRDDRGSMAISSVTNTTSMTRIACVTC